MPGRVSQDPLPAIPATDYCYRPPDYHPFVSETFLMVIERVMEDYMSVARVRAFILVLRLLGIMDFEIELLFDGFCTIGFAR